jgi:hypothetical protein
MTRVLLSAQQPFMSAPPQEWKDFIAKMDSYAAAGDENAAMWARIGRKHLAEQGGDSGVMGGDAK